MKNYCIDCLNKGIKTEISLKVKRCQSCAQKNRFKNKENHPFFGKKHSETHKKRISKTLKKAYKEGRKKVCHTKKSKKIISDKAKERFKDPTKHPNFKDGRTLQKYYCKEPDCNREISLCSALYHQGRCQSCAKKGKLGYWYGKKRPEHSKKMSGKGSPTYIDGKGNDPYPLEFNNKLKEQIHKRDNHKCQVCNKSQLEKGKKLSTHHIDYNKENNKEDNLISLCQNCHVKTNYNRKVWKKYFKIKE